MGLEMPESLRLEFFEKFLANNFALTDAEDNTLLTNTLIHQLTYACEQYTNFQDSETIFMTNNFKTLPIMLWRQLKFGTFSV